MIRGPAKTMRILQINSTKNFGGGERHFVDICSALKERGYEVFAVIHPESVWRERLSFLGKNVFSVSVRNSIDIFSALKIARICKEQKIEIVHAHSAKDYFPVSLACRIAGISKFFITRHVLFPMSRLQRTALKNVRKAIAVSESVREILKETFPDEKINVIPNGIHIENWATSDNPDIRKEFFSFHKIPQNAKIIATLGELKELKGQQEFILAAKTLAQEFPEAFFVIVGRDNSLSQGFRKKLKRLVKVLGLENRFLFLDWVENTADFFQVVDIFVSPSRMESFGLAILEAMASGKAIVATKTKGALELLQDNSSAKLVPVESPFELAQAIKFFLLDEKAQKDFGEMARKTAAEKFHIEQMIDRIEEVYNG
jgi:glycosyltransferase involved in cell wall biosynthesis